MHDSHLNALDSLDFSPIRFTSLCHSTHTKHLRRIARDPELATFVGEPKDGYPSSLRLKAHRLSWWSPVVTAEEKDRLRDHVRRQREDLRRRRKDEGKDEDDYMFLSAFMDADLATSPAFDSTSSRYGPHGLIARVQSLLDAFAAHWEVERSQLQYRKFGTFSYKREWMHTILVFPPLSKFKENFRLDIDKTFPELGTSDDFLRRLDDGSWEWRMRSSSGNSGGWEHPTFAFRLRNRPWTIPRKHFKRVTFKHCKTHIDSWGNPGICIPSFKNRWICYECEEPITAGDLSLFENGDVDADDAGPGVTGEAGSLPVNALDDGMGSMTDCFTSLSLNTTEVAAPEGATPFGAMGTLSSSSSPPSTAANSRSISSPVSQSGSAPAKAPSSVVPARDPSSSSSLPTANPLVTRTPTSSVDVPAAPVLLETATHQFSGDMRAPSQGSPSATNTGSLALSPAVAVRKPPGPTPS
ncbi:hypothetical protein HDU90_005145 [Geranomyces variabilis]|nr:hypothetical protein HDU90_005145 [Geranomyces variabilis]